MFEQHSCLKLQSFILCKILLEIVLVLWGVGGELDAGGGGVWGGGGCEEGQIKLLEFGVGFAVQRMAAPKTMLNFT